MAKREEIFRNITEETKERGKRLFVMELGNGTFAVASSSKPNTGHVVSIQGGYNCDCLGFMHKADCAHIFAVHYFLTNKKKS